MPIRLRLTLWYAALLGGMLIVFSGALYGVVHLSLYSEIERTLELQARSRVDSVEFVFKVQTQAITEKTAIQIVPFEASAAPDTFIELRLIPNQGVVSRSQNLGTDRLPLSRTALERVTEGESYTTRADFHGLPLMIHSRPVEFNNNVVGMIQAARSLADIERTLQRLLFFLLVGTALTTGLAAVVGFWFAERALTPVDTVTQAALRISRAEDLSRRLPPYAPGDEIGRLIEAFNEMLGRLDEVFQDQQRFVADVSHELRTPLTALRGGIDLLRRGAFTTEAARQEALTTIDSEVARLNRLVADLLLLARADGGDALIQEPVELDTLLLDVFRQGQILARASNHEVRLRLGHEDQATIVGDADRLRQLLLNLVDNAIKYTQEGTITLSLWRDDRAGMVQLVVEDSGIGIPESSLPLLFHRFYRVDRARSRRHGGSGLGLAIVQWIVQAHRGHITVRSKEGEGSTFVVTLPLPSDEALRAASRPARSLQSVPLPPARVLATGPRPAEPR